MLHLVYISCSVLSYHSAANSLSSPDALLLVGTQQGDYFLNTVFLGQLILFECRQNIPYKGKTTPKNFSKIKKKMGNCSEQVSRTEEPSSEGLESSTSHISYSQYPVKPPSQPNPPWPHTLATPLQLCLFVHC